MNGEGRILIVDDEERWRNELVETLERGGFQADSASTAAEALERLENALYHVLVLDIRMVHTDQSNIEGITLLSELDRRGLSKATKVIMLSAFGTPEQMRTSFRKYKVVDFLSKDGFDNQEFLENVRQVFTQQMKINQALETHRQKSNEVNLTLVAPYTTTGPTPAHFFFGREHELREISDHLLTTSYVLIGGRRIGKTSIVGCLHLIRLPSAGFRSIYHDCSTTPSFEAFQNATISDWKPEPPSKIRVTFYDVFQSLPDDKPLVLLLDEADKLVPVDRKDGWRFFNTLRALVNSGHAHVVLSGERVLREALRDSSSPLYNFGSEILVGRLNLKDVRELVTQPMKQLEIELVGEKAIVDYIWDFSSGHPNVVQRLCRRLIELLNEDDRRSISLDNVKEIVEDPKFQRDDFLSTYWEDATLLERILSLLLAKIGRQPYALHDIRQLLDTHIGLVDPSGERPSGIEVDAALGRLVELRSILENTPEGYIFAVSAFPLVVCRPNVVTFDDLFDIYSEAYRKYGDLTLEEVTARELEK